MQIRKGDNITGQYLEFASIVLTKIIQAIFLRILEKM